MTIKCWGTGATGAKIADLGDADRALMTRARRVDTLVMHARCNVERPPCPGRAGGPSAFHVSVQVGRRDPLT